MRVLLDTHALLWHRGGQTARISATVRELIEDSANDVYVSAATAWEVATKYGLGKLPSAGPLGIDFTQAIVTAGYTPLAITTNHAQAAGALPPHHRDPFDRMLIAQALLERMPLVSNEALFDRYGVVRIW